MKALEDIISQTMAELMKSGVVEEIVKECVGELFAHNTHPSDDAPLMESNVRIVFAHKVITMLVEAKASPQEQRKILLLAMELVEDALHVHCNCQPVIHYP